MSVAARAITSKADQGRPTRAAIRSPMRSRTGRENPRASVNWAAAETSSAGGPTNTAASVFNPSCNAAVAVSAPAE